MDKKFIFNAAIIFLSLISSMSEALFFGRPKKSFLDLFHSIKEKKENFKKTLHRDEVHHYHLHYYPVLPVRLIYDHNFSKPPFIASEKPILDQIHRQKFRSLGWTSNEYKHVPHPKIIATNHQSLNLDRFIENHDNINDNQNHDPSHCLFAEGFTPKDEIDLAAIRHRFGDRDNHREESRDQRKDHHHYYYNPSEISFDLPFHLHREIVIHPANSASLNDVVVENEEKKETPSENFNPVIDFFQNLHRGIKNSIFHYTEADNNDKDFDRIVTADSNTDANAYAILNLDR